MWAVYAAKYTNQYNMQCRLDNSERSWSTMQEIVLRTKLHDPLGRGVEERLGSLLVLNGDSGYLYTCRFK
ncbi:hypothetical protein EVAR_4151_1 [Eumeta japonica]|uniref:Uncharacterized protein n=1 Tax=Eumeta variegata TaxID=151549 RepID=A0A4C1TIX2_EUMVA|nr:hypothetical protein EVAR_4151_1 [Eumeta japonica]